ncbi:hypothetical protein F2Q68_00013927 [Brassica cretica]|uniref:Uncharacterized protein n=1 Tax=Brassica cretica TaxID=69181 RepID=A0A8S9HMB3_BRACR|nr:hypothetical protein F2Q68_00013927 [Brassica cretica]
MGDDDGSQGKGSGSQGVPTVPVADPGGPKGSWVGAETLEVRGEEKTVENQSIRVEENSSIQQGSENDQERTEKLNEVLVENLEEVLASVTEIKDERVLEQVVLLKDAMAIETGATTPVETETVEEKEWLDFSPGKSSRSPLRKEGEIVEDGKEEVATKPADDDSL